MNGCPPVIACRPAEGTHAFSEGVFRCDCSELPNVGDPLAIVNAARAVVDRRELIYGAPGRLLASITVLADLLPPEARS